MLARENVVTVCLHEDIGHGKEAVLMCFMLQALVLLNLVRFLLPSFVYSATFNVAKRRVEGLEV